MPENKHLWVRSKIDVQVGGRSLCVNSASFPDLGVPRGRIDCPAIVIVGVCRSTRYSYRHHLSFGWCCAAKPSPLQTTTVSKSSSRRLKKRGNSLIQGICPAAFTPHLKVPAECRPTDRHTMPSTRSDEDARPVRPVGDKQQPSTFLHLVPTQRTLSCRPKITCPTASCGRK